MAEPSSRSVYPCPACGMHTARHLDEVSRDALANFYECTSCHHLWTVNKFDPSKMTHLTSLVTLRPKKDRRIGQPSKPSE